MTRAPIVRRSRTVPIAAVVLAVSAFLPARAARAEFPLPLPHEIHREVREHVHDVLTLLGRIPEQIERAHQRHLEVFFGGSNYYAPHRHNHLTYNFPVWIDGDVAYRPYSYCNDRLYGSYASRPQVWAGWGQESQGHWCNDHHGYYPNGHACFLHYRYRRPVQRYDSRTYEAPRYRGEWYGSRQSGHSEHPGRYERRYDARREWYAPQRRDWNPRYEFPRQWSGPERHGSWQGQGNRRPQERGQRQGQHPRKLPHGDSHGSRHHD